MCKRKLHETNHPDIRHRSRWGEKVQNIQCRQNSCMVWLYIVLFPVNDQLDVKLIRYDGDLPASAVSDIQAETTIIIIIINTLFIYSALPCNTHTDWLRLLYLLLPRAMLLPGIVFTHGPIFRFFATQRRHVAPVKVKFSREELLCAKCHLDRLKNVGLRPQNFESLEFYQYNCP